MRQNMMNNSNNILRYAFAGVLLFIAAIGFIIAPQSPDVSVELTFTFISLGVTVAATSLFSKAVKDDINKLSGI